MLPALSAQPKNPWMRSVSPTAHQRKDAKIGELARSLNKIRILSQPRPAPVQRSESTDIPAEFRESLTLEHFAPLQVLNVRLLGQKGDLHRCTILEINDLYSQISAHLTEPFSKTNHLPKHKAGYLGLGFEDMRASLEANKFLRPVPDCIQAPKKMIFTPEQTAKLRAAGAPDLSRIKPEQYFLRENSHPSSVRESFHQLGTWYREKISVLVKNPGENSFANSSTLYSFVFRELLKLQASECSQLAQLLLLLYTHSVALVETGWKCSKAIHHFISKSQGHVGGTGEPTVESHQNTWRDVQKMQEEIGSKIGLSPHHTESSDQLRSSQRSLNRSMRNVPIIKIGKEDDLSGDGAGLAVAGRRPTSFLHESELATPSPSRNLLAVPKVNLASPPVVFRDDMQGNSQDPDSARGLVMKPQIFKFNKRKSKYENTTTEHTKAENSLVDLQETTPKDQNNSQRTKVVIQAISGDENSFRSGYSLSTSSDKLSRSSEKKPNKLQDSLSEEAN